MSTVPAAMLHCNPGRCRARFALCRHKLLLSARSSIRVPARSLVAAPLVCDVKRTHCCFHSNVPLTGTSVNRACPPSADGSHPIVAGQELLPAAHWLLLLLLLLLAGSTCRPRAEPYCTRAPAHSRPPPPPRPASIHESMIHGPFTLRTCGPVDLRTGTLTAHRTHNLQPQNPDHTSPSHPTPTPPKPSPARLSPTLPCCTLPSPTLLTTTRPVKLPGRDRRLRSTNPIQTPWLPSLATIVVRARSEASPPSPPTCSFGTCCPRRPHADSLPQIIVGLLEPQPLPHMFLIRD